MFLRGENLGLSLLAEIDDDVFFFVVVDVVIGKIVVVVWWLRGGFHRASRGERVRTHGLL